MELKIVESPDAPEDYLDDLLYGDHPEHILFEHSYDALFTEIHEIYTDPDIGPGQISRATCWDECLDYMLYECTVGRIGMYVAEDIELHYTRGDGWTTDDDCELEGGPIRPACWYEMRMVFSWFECLKRFPTQLKLHWLYSQGFTM